MRSLIFVFLIISANSIAQSTKGTIKIKKVPMDTTIYSCEGVLDVFPAYTGGDAAFLAFLNKTIVYPQDAKEAGLSGTCYVTFVVNKDGTLSNITILHGVSGCPSCDMEALRFFNLMPPWQPGIKDGNPVRAWINMPLKFTLK